MAQATTAASDTSGMHSYAPMQNKTNQHLDNDDYPSTQSDDEVDGVAPTSESRPLLADANPAALLDNAGASMDTRAASSLIANSMAQLTGRKRRTPLKWTEVIWVTLTLSLIAVLGYSSQLCIMLPYYRKTPSFSPQTLAAVLVPFNLGLLEIFYNYWLCVSTDPGSVPAGWQPEWEALEPVAPHLAHHLPHSDPTDTATASKATTRAEQEPTLELKQQIYRPRYCKTCSAFKPPRSHHCKACQRCVLRMDHHCPWVANCVGHFNYAYFLRFLFWVDVTCCYHLVMVSCRVLDRFNSYTYWREPSARELVWLVVNYALCIPVIVLVGVFSLYHFYCVAVNQTTIESWEKDRTATMIRRGRVRKIKYPYDLGVWRNVRGVLGDNPVFWCLPVEPKKGDEAQGLKYPVANGLGKYRSSFSLRSHRSRHWRLQTAAQDGEPWTEMEDEKVVESFVDPKLEASVMHRLRWEHWHRLQAEWRHRQAQVRGGAGSKV